MMLLGCWTSSPGMSDLFHSLFEFPLHLIAGRWHCVQNWGLSHIIHDFELTMWINAAVACLASLRLEFSDECLSPVLSCQHALRHDGISSTTSACSIEP